jgi:hypothetical protein
VPVRDLPRLLGEQAQLGHPALAERAPVADGQDVGADRERLDQAGVHGAQHHLKLLPVQVGVVGA